MPGQAAPISLILQDPSSQIRLLLLHPGEAHEDVYCTAICCKLSEAPDFHAISYTWGSVEPKQTIFVNHQQALVGPNCRYALWQSREYCQSAYVWIDSVCIDQENPHEKSAQVALMGDIYAKARRVLACIGASDESSEFIRQNLPSIGDRIQVFTDEWWDAGPARIKELWRPPRGEAAILELCDHWDRFCERPYFQRLWVVQELYEGAERIIVLCGLSTLDWDDLVELQWRLYYCFNIHNPGPIPRTPCSEAIKGLSALIMHWDAEDTNLMGFIEQTISLSCMDPRDRVYGTIRLVKWERLGIPTPKPDYSISNFDLALELIRWISTSQFNDVVCIAMALNLQQEDQSKLWARVTKTLRAIEFPLQLRAYCSWPISINGSCRIEVDNGGRLCADLKYDDRCIEAPGVRALRNATLPRLSNNNNNFAEIPLILNGSQPVQVFTGLEVSAITWSNVQLGDILVRFPYFDAVLRPRDNGLSFEMIGKALLISKYTTKSEIDWSCRCWATPDPNFKSRIVELAFEASTEEVLAYAAACVALDDDSPSTLLQQLSCNIPARGSLLKDVTAVDWREDQTIRPMRTYCPEHDAKECSNLSRKGFHFSLFSGCGAYIQVKK